MAADHPLETRLAQEWLLERWSDVTVLVAVSGGADSVALLRALHRLTSSGKGRLIVAHFNHRWRGEESDGDELFVRRLCHDLRIKLVVGRALRAAEGISRREAAARQLRYRFFTKVAGRLGARYLVTAHTGDDQTETVLQRILRGTGLAGLGGIPGVRRLNLATTLIRPMLSITRSEVRDYLAALDQPFREDSSNVDVRYIRNRIRHELLPLARSCYPAADEAIRRLAELASEAQDFIGIRVEELLECVRLDKRRDRVTFDAEVAELFDFYLARETLMRAWREMDWPRQGMTFEKWTQLADMLTTRTKGEHTIVLPGEIVAKKKGGSLSLSRPKK